LGNETLTSLLITAAGGLAAGAACGFCKATDSHTDLRIENYAVVAPTLFGIISGRAIARKVYHALVEDEIKKRGETSEIFEGEGYKIGRAISGVKGAFNAGLLGVVSTAIGFGAGYGVGFLTR
jgi:hypothetical protein